MSDLAKKWFEEFSRSHRALTDLLVVQTKPVWLIPKGSDTDVIKAAYRGDDILVVEPNEKYRPERVPPIIGPDLMAEIVREYLASHQKLRTVFVEED